jgi:type I restriction enzyme, R subunit
MRLSPKLVSQKRTNSTPQAEDEGRRKASLSEPFKQVGNAKTPVFIERIVAEIDDSVPLLQFPAWRQTAAGERGVKEALTTSLLMYQLEQYADLFERAYGDIRQHNCR